MACGSSKKAPSTHNSFSLKKGRPASSVFSASSVSDTAPSKMPVQMSCFMSTIGKSSSADTGVKEWRAAKASI